MAEKKLDTQIDSIKMTKAVTVSGLDSGTNTIKVTVERQFRHPRYEKQIRRHKSYLVDIRDEDKEGLRVGDVILVENTKPISATKKMRFIKVITKKN